MTYPSATAMPRVISSEPEFSQEGSLALITRFARRKAASRSQENLQPVGVRPRRSKSRNENLMKASKNPNSSVKSENKNKSAPRLVDSNFTTNQSQTSSIPQDQTRIVDSLIETSTHCRWREFISRHEVPRKFLHVSIGVFSVYLYMAGVQTTAITPWLVCALVPISAMDFLRLNIKPLNKIYIRILGPLMRESEYQCLNGVIWYLIGAWFVLRVFPKDIGLMGILLLSWCDTAASTVGRAFGQYTPNIRKGKSLAGSTAAFIVGVFSAAAFWGWLAPMSGSFPGDQNFPFMFTGTIKIPSLIRDSLGLTESQSSVKGIQALSIMSLWTGFVASASEALAIFGMDDNLTIPALSGIGMWGFLKVFG